MKQTKILELSKVTSRCGKCGTVARELTWPGFLLKTAKNTGWGLVRGAGIILILILGIMTWKGIEPDSFASPYYQITEGVSPACASLLAATLEVQEQFLEEQAPNEQKAFLTFIGQEDMQNMVMWIVRDENATPLVQVMESVCADELRRLHSGAPWSQRANITGANAHLGQKKGISILTQIRKETWNTNG